MRPPVAFLRAGEAALDHEGRLAGLRELVGRHGARAPGAHDDRVEIGLSHVPLLSPLPSLFFQYGQRAPCPRITEAKAATRRGAPPSRASLVSKAVPPSKAAQRRESKGGCPACPPSEFPFGDLLRFAPRRRTHRAGQSSGLSVRARTAERLGMPGTLPVRSRRPTEPPPASAGRPSGRPRGRSRTA